MAGGKRHVMSPQVYRAPHKVNTSRTMMTTSKMAAPPKKVLPAPSAGPKPEETVKRVYCCTTQIEPSLSKGTFNT
ncbi:uncharacterized protein Z518_07677 [Rhinocladiella mackenziei CBS 650.93]|uniref:Uncharacterized protein n=1 Tax=Rhinocladiella mackenziei CBS 650.93 TaxID=1442369 RepID=A0A0D2IE77_9EURO|nr:uncharacterized protein Z518_07677 [Rhinocladiella mackenziei CBS 650.93]KIX04124.1 hypothetical protein Z518_07677 [Rhinocladiella mackenziei CBS 650.93]